MGKKKYLLIIYVVVIVVVAFTMISRKEMELEEALERFERVVGEVLSEDFQRVSKTEIIATIIYGHDTDKTNNIYYRILKTTYSKGERPSSITGVNTDALIALFAIDTVDSCEEVLIQDWYGALYKKDDIAYLCWTCDSETTYVLEYTPSKISDSEIIKMAESVKLIE